MPRAADRLNVIERLRNSFRSNWDRLTNRLDIFRTEMDVSRQVFHESVEEIREQSQPLVETAREVWNTLGENFGQRLVGAARLAGGEIRRGWQVLRENVADGMEQLRDRYQQEGVVGATLGIVAEAMETVRELPDRVGTAVNMFRETVEIAKVAKIEEMENDGERTRMDRNQLDQLSETRRFVEEKRDKFQERWIKCQERLAAMQLGREKFVQVRGNLVLQAVPAAE